MKCADFEDRLNELLDDRLAPQDDATLVAHAASCADCRDTLAAHDSLFQGLALLNRRTVSPELGKQVLRELNAPAAVVPPLPSSPRRGWFPLLATAAAVLLAVGLSVWIANRGNKLPAVAEPGSRGSNGNGLAIAKPGLRAPKPVEPQQAPVSPGAIVVKPEHFPTPEENEAYRQTMASLASQWSTNAQWPHVETLNVEQYAPGIRPIRESFEVALDALLRTIPSGKKDVRTPPQAIQPYGGMLDLA